MNRGNTWRKTADEILRLGDELKHFWGGNFKMDSFILTAILRYNCCTLNCTYLLYTISWIRICTRIENSHGKIWEKNLPGKTTSCVKAIRQRGSGYVCKNAKWPAQVKLNGQGEESWNDRCCIDK